MSLSYLSSQCTAALHVFRAQPSRTSDAIPNIAQRTISIVAFPKNTNSSEMATCYSRRNMQSKLNPIIGAVSPVTSSSPSSLLSSAASLGALNADCKCRQPTTATATTTITTLDQMWSTVAIAAATVVVEAAVDVR